MYVYMYVLVKIIITVRIIIVIIILILISFYIVFSTSLSFLVEKQSEWIYFPSSRVSERTNIGRR